MDEKAKNRRPGGKGRLALIFFALALALLATAACLFTVRVGGRLYVCADVADARGAALSCEEYDEAAARSGFKQIRWSVPIGSERCDSFSEILTLSSLPGGEEEDRPPVPGGAVPTGTLYLRLASREDRLFQRVKDLFLLFPGESRTVVYFADTGRKAGAACLLHDALLEELTLLLGEENVIVKDPA